MTFEKRQSGPGRMFQKEHLELDTGDSAPGRYTLRQTVTDAATGEQVTRTSDFFIVKTD